MLACYLPRYASSRKWVRTTLERYGKVEPVLDAGIVSIKEKCPAFSKPGISHSVYETDGQSISSIKLWDNWGGILANLLISLPRPNLFRHRFSGA